MVITSFYEIIVRGFVAKKILMPQLSDTMDSGKILEWHKAVGDTVSRGDILAEVETDKANLEIESFDNGTLLKIEINAGEVANVGSVIAHIGQQGEAIESSPTPQAQTPELKGNNSENIPEPTFAPLQNTCLLYTSPSPRDGLLSRMPSSA